MLSAAELLEEHDKKEHKSNVDGCASCWIEQEQKKIKEKEDGN